MNKIKDVKDYVISSNVETKATKGVDMKAKMKAFIKNGYDL